MFRLGVITDEISDNFERALDIVGEWGLQDIEIHTLWDTHVEALTDEQVARLQTTLKERRLRLVVLDSTAFLRCPLYGDAVPESWSKRFQSIGGTFDVHLSALERCLQIAQRLEVPFVRIFGFWGAGKLTQEVVQDIASQLQTPIRLAVQAGVVLVLENCPHTYLDHTRHVLRVLELIDSPYLRLLWDPSNAYRSGERDVADLVSEVSPFLAHMHVKGVTLDSRAVRGREYVMIEKGDIDYRHLLQQVMLAGYEGVVSLEPHYALPKGGREGAARESFGSLLRIVNSLG
jgi:L-ribulose-5-phosphate 3-epimerase